MATRVRTCEQPAQAAHAPNHTPTALHTLAILSHSHCSPLRMLSGSQCCCQSTCAHTLAPARSAALSPASGSISSAAALPVLGALLWPVRWGAAGLHDQWSCRREGWQGRRASILWAVCCVPAARRAAGRHPAAVNHCCFKRLPYCLPPSRTACRLLPVPRLALPWTAKAPRRPAGRQAGQVRQSGACQQPHSFCALSKTTSSASAAQRCVHQQTTQHAGMWHTSFALRPPDRGMERCTTLCATAQQLQSSCVVAWLLVRCRPACAQVGQSAVRAHQALPPCLDVQPDISSTHIAACKNRCRAEREPHTKRSDSAGSSPACPTLHA